MATSDDGNFSGFRGKLGSIVYYYLNGRYVARTIGISTKEPSILQLAVRMIAKLISAFLSPLKAFIGVGFELKAKDTKTNQHNQAFSYISKNAIKGSYPEIEVDYQKVLLTLGNMPLPLNPEVKMTAAGLAFTWDTELKITGTHWTDQVMLVAYFPELNKAVYLTAGARRNEGVQHLPLTGIERGYVVETYFSFIAEDRKSIANSLYTGQLWW